VVPKSSNADDRLDRALNGALACVNADLAIVGLHVTLERLEPKTHARHLRYCLWCSGEAAPPGRSAVVNVEPGVLSAMIDGTEGDSIPTAFTRQTSEPEIYEFLLEVIESLLVRSARPPQARLV
jgi:hypothetical protein